LSAASVRVACVVEGKFDNTYESEIEIDRRESEILDSNCDCTYTYDCQHLAAATFHLEKYLNKLVVEFSEESGKEIEEEEVKEAIEEAATKERAREGKKREKELLQEYQQAASVLASSPYFLPEEQSANDQAELMLLFSTETRPKPSQVALQLALRLPGRTKPQLIPDVKEFLNAIRYHEVYHLSNRRFHFAVHSFDSVSQEQLKLILNFGAGLEIDGSPSRFVVVDVETFGTILAITQSKSSSQAAGLFGIYLDSFDKPLPFSVEEAVIRFELEHFEAHEPKLLLNPTLILGDKRVPLSEEMILFECAFPGVLHQGVFRRFKSHICRQHLRHLGEFQAVTIPENLFGTFVENALPELLRFAEVANRDILNKFVTLPHTEMIEGECHLTYLEGELEATFSFRYGDIVVPVVQQTKNMDPLSLFIGKEGVLARNLVEEKELIDTLFKEFVYDQKQQIFKLKSEKKIVEFMTELLPRYQNQVEFHCPEHLLEQFIYDETEFTLKLKEGEQIDQYWVHLVVDGPLQGTTIDLLWDCIALGKNYIELVKGKKRRAPQKVLVLDLKRLAPIVQMFDELGLTQINTHKELRPLWSLVSVVEKEFKKLPIQFSMSRKLKQIQKQMLGGIPEEIQTIPKVVKADLRDYQKEGVSWLDRLRKMHLCGILADDMGLGKTLQTIVALTLYAEGGEGKPSLVVCPTSLIYNWQEEIEKYNASLTTLCIDGTPENRKKLIGKATGYNVVITSYSLLQKDIEHYKKQEFGYLVLDEAQHIKNRSTRNAKSVKALKGSHRLILTGTPIENSLSDLWSLFDFLMPGLLSTYERFTDKYLKGNASEEGAHLDKLRAKLSPFILRRLKKDVLSELPPVREITYYCHMTEKQKELYSSYAQAAKQELTQLVEKEGFDKVQIHILATLTRLKQICCHPAIFAKDQPEEGDSAKYEMLMELVQNLVAGGHKTVIFSQYTRMLGIMRKELEKLGILFEYLDGSTKNRLSIVKKFNEADHIPVFLVSLKAGGTGLNLVGADTVIHIDLWWNPAVEAQATDRVHRIGQNNSVSAYRLITRGTIEEKIVEILEGKKELTEQLINKQEKAISKMFTWQDVLKLLQT